MRNHHAAVLVLFAILTTLFFATACVPTPNPTENPHSPEGAIKTLQSQAGLPDLPIQFEGIVTMEMSPDGQLQVALYTDSQGRSFFLDQETDQVIELDARSLPLSPEGRILSEAELGATAEKLVRMLLPGFEAKLKNLDVITGTESDVYSFWWRSQDTGEWANPPYIQIGLNAHGELVAYVNTLILPQ